MTTILPVSMLMLNPTSWGAVLSSVNVFRCRCRSDDSRGGGRGIGVVVGVVVVITVVVVIDVGVVALDWWWAR